MKANDAPPYVIGAVVLLTIAAGIWAVGGPATGKQEKRDKVRMSDISKLNGHVRCIAKISDKTLPETLPSAAETIRECSPSPRLTDPFIDERYVYERISDKAFRLCAAFENPELIAFGQSFDPEAGCMTYQYTP